MSICIFSLNKFSFFVYIAAWFFVPQFISVFALRLIMPYRNQPAAKQKTNRQKINTPAASSGHGA